MLPDNGPRFKITDTKIYIPVVSLRSIKNGKLLRMLENGFTKTVTWNKTRIKEVWHNMINCLDVIADPSFQGINRMFVLTFPNEDTDPAREDTKRLESYNLSIDGRNFFNTPIKIGDRKGYENLRGMMIGNGNDYTVGSMMEYNYFKNTYKIIAIDLSR